MRVGDGARPKPPEPCAGGPAWDKQPAEFSEGVIRAPRWLGLSPEEGGSGGHRSLPVSQARPRMAQLPSQAGISQLPQIISALIEWGPDNVIMHHIPQFI